MHQNSDFFQLGVLRRLSKSCLIIIAALLISSAPGNILGEDSVSGCLQIAAHKIKQGQRVIVTAAGGMTTRGGLVTIDTVKGTLTVRALGDARAKFAHMTFMEYQIAKIETERRWQPLYFLGGLFLGGMTGAALANGMDDNDGTSSSGKKIAVYGISMMAGASLGFFLSITQGDKIVIECSQLP